MTDIILPYYQLFAKWDELRYALRSIDKNLIGDYQLIIIGDLPDWITNVRHIPHERRNIVSGSNLFDALSKLQLAINDAEISDHFIRWYDDCYLIKPLEVQEFNKHWVLFDLKLRQKAEYSLWHKHLWATFDILKNQCMQVWNCESHLPRLFEKHKVQEIFKRYGLPGNKVLIETLYFNLVPPSDPLFLSSNDKIKGGFYGTEDLYSCNARESNKIRKYLSSKKFINHNDAGLSDGLKKTIEKLFPNKSKFEK